MKTPPVFFQIQHVERVPLGFALAGVNEAWNELTLTEIKAEIGKEVSVVSNEGKACNYDVIDVMATTSIIGRRNVFILIPESGVPPSVGSRVCKKF